MSLRLVRSDQALRDTKAAMSHGRGYARAARAVVDMERFAELGWTVGRLVRLRTGVFYQVRVGSWWSWRSWAPARSLSILPCPPPLAGYDRRDHAAQCWAAAHPRAPRVPPADSEALSCWPGTVGCRASASACSRRSSSGSRWPRPVSVMRKYRRCTSSCSGIGSAGRLCRTGRREGFRKASSRPAGCSSAPRQ